MRKTSTRFTLKRPISGLNLTYGDKEVQTQNMKPLKRYHFTDLYQLLKGCQLLSWMTVVNNCNRMLLNILQKQRRTFLHNLLSITLLEALLFCVQNGRVTAGYAR